MNIEDTATKRSLIVLGFLISILAISLVLPARWLGVKPREYSKLNLDDLTPISKLQVDNNNNNSPDWRDLAIASLGTSTKKTLENIQVDPATKKRLADPNNITASFSKNMYMASAYLQQNGGATQEDQEKLITSMLAVEAKKVVIITYTQNDITLAKTDTNEDKRRYGNALGILMQKAIAYKMGDGDLEIIQAYTTSKDASLLKAFTIKRDRLDTLIASMTSMPVPYSAIPYHLVALNRISEYRTILDNFSQLESDPVRSSLSLSNYTSSMKALFTTITNVREYFRVENIQFTEKEAGYIFTSGYTTP